MALKPEVASYQEVYTHPALRSLARKYAQAYVEPDDLLQEAAMAVWEAQQKNVTNERWLFREARCAMHRAACRGSSVDRTWPTHQRKRHVRTQNISDLSPRPDGDPDGSSPLEWLGGDERADQIPMIVALREIIERIYAHQDYSDTQRVLLRGYREGLSISELGEVLGKRESTVYLAQRELRQKILVRVLGGDSLPWPESDASYLTEREKQVLDGLAQGKSYREIGLSLGISKSAVCVYTRIIRSKATLAELGWPSSLGEQVKRVWG